jgi:hypothetical protein
MDMPCVADAAALDFEAATSYTLLVSVYDGFRRSTSTAVRIDVRNENDLRVPKPVAPPLLRLGATLGRCRSQ